MLHVHRLTIIGDSNARNAHVAHGRKVTNQYGFPVQFLPATSLHAGLEHLSRSAVAKETLVLVDFVANGLVDAVDTMMEGPEFDQEIERTVGVYAHALAEASKDIPVLAVMLPMFRAFPSWFPAQHESICARIIGLLRGTSVKIVQPMQITGADLNTDGIHLNQESLGAFHTHMMSSAFGQNWSPLKGLRHNEMVGDIDEAPGTSRKRGPTQEGIGGGVTPEKSKLPRTKTPRSEGMRATRDSNNFGASGTAMDEGLDEVNNVCLCISFSSPTTKPRPCSQPGVDCSTIWP